MPILSGLPESDGDAKVQWIERPNPEPELHPPDLAKRGVIGVVIDVVKTIVKAFQKKVAEEKDHRSHWTEDMVSRMHEKDPTLNYVICDVKHEFIPADPNKHD